MTELPSRKATLLRAFAGLVIVVVTDQLTKSLVVNALTLGELRPIVPGVFNLTLTLNPGAAFGLFGNLSEPLRTIVLFAVSGIAVLTVIYFLVREYRGDRWAEIALGLILGGASGNLIDRFRLGKVVDFLDFHVADWHWPAFNVADSAICLGVAILLIRGNVRPPQETPECSN